MVELGRAPFYEDIKALDPIVQGLIQAAPQGPVQKGNIPVANVTGQCLGRLRRKRSQLVEKLPELNLNSGREKMQVWIRAVNQ